MNSHTSWYPVDGPPESMQSQQPAQMRHNLSYCQEREEERPISMPNMPFRLVTSTGGVPYPLHVGDTTTEQSHMVDLISGEHFHRADSIRQPVAEDFLHPQHSYPVPPLEIHEWDQYLDIIEPIEEYESDPYLPIIEPDSYFLSDHTDHLCPHSVGAVDLARRYTIEPTKPSYLDTRVLDFKRSKSAADVLDATDSEHDNVPAMGADMFSPALRGLHRLPSATPHKASRLRRIKRFFSLKRGRQYGRATR